MFIDISQFHNAIIVILPMLIALIAGAIRQDKLPSMANELISYGLVLVVAITQALLDGKLGGNPLTDFVIIMAYGSIALSTPPFAMLQQYLQSNIFSLGKPALPATAPVPLPQIVVNTTDLANRFLEQLNLPQLASLLSSELMTLAKEQAQATVKSPVAQQSAISNAPTQPALQVVRDSTPPMGG